MLNGKYAQVEHDVDTGLATAEQYADGMSPDTKIVTVVHTSPVTGMTVDLEEIARTVREISPECYIIVDGIQNAAHGPVDISRYPIDAYVISPYKIFARHGFGIAWISSRLAKLPHCRLDGSSPLCQATCTIAPLTTRRSDPSLLRGKKLDDD